MNIISRASDCSIKTFIACKFDGKFSTLVIEGEPSDEQLLQAFDAIETEYNDLIGKIPEHMVKMNRLNKQIARNEAFKQHMFAIDTVIDAVFDLVPTSEMMSDDADVYLEKPIALVKGSLEQLALIGVRIAWNKNINEFKKSIKRAKKIENTQVIKLKELKHELDASSAIVTNSPQYTRTNFTKLKIAVQSLVGYNIPENETNMHDYGIMCFSYFEMLKNQSPN